MEHQDTDTARNRRSRYPAGQTAECFVTLSFCHLGHVWIEFSQSVRTKQQRLSKTYHLIKVAVTLVNSVCIKYLLNVWFFYRQKMVLACCLT